MPYVYAAAECRALYACLTRTPCTCMYALYVCLICMPYMYAYVCLLCMPHVPDVYTGCPDERGAATRQAAYHAAQRQPRQAQCYSGVP